MKTKIQEVPEGRPTIVLIRLSPESSTERKDIGKIREALRGTNAIATTPEVEDERVLSLMFNLHAKKNQTKKA